MQIHELNTGTLQSTDYIAIDNGSDTRKIDYGAQMGTTSISGIGNGTVTGAISALNSKTTANITLEPNVTQLSAYDSIFEKTGKMVTAYFAATSSTNISSGTKIATIPSGFRPPRTFRYVVYATGGTGCLEFQNNGAINLIGSINSGVSLIGIVTYQI